jgi:hypothetical protein
MKKKPGALPGDPSNETGLVSCFSSLFWVSDELLSRESKTLIS